MKIVRGIKMKKQETKKVYFDYFLEIENKLKRKNIYGFELLVEDLEEAKKRTEKNKLFIIFKYGIMALYTENKKLNMEYYTTINYFKEISRNRKERLLK